MKNILDSLVRTVTPVIVGAIITFFTSRGIEVDPQLAPSITAGIGVAVTAGYYLVIRLLETYASPHFGWLLGSANRPDYGHTPGAHVAE